MGVSPKWLLLAVAGLQLLALARGYTTRPPYLDVKSVEVDSSEHGGPPGRKGTTCPCGWANKQSARIIGGKVTKVNEFPFVAAVSYRGTFMPFCGGTIVSPYHVVTAGHCVTNDEDGEGFQVILGEHDYLTGRETNATKVYVVDRVIIHENYKPPVKHYDVAMFVLKEKIEFNQFIGPACVARRPMTLDGQYVRALGWGLTSPHGEDSEQLKKVDLRVVPFDTCAELIGASVKVDDRHQICTYSKMQGIGRGDSGGPLVWLNPETNRYTLVGITSFVRLYTTENFYPDVYADATIFMPWILRKMRETKPDAFTCWAEQ